MKKIYRAEILSEDNNKLIIELNAGVCIEGISLGIEPAFDDEGEELDYDVLVFKADNLESLYRLREEEIRSVQIIDPSNKE